MSKVIVNRRTLKIVVIVLIAYYQIDYKRHFISNEDKTEFVTIWQRLGNDCYIIPGKYYWILAPTGNYIRTKNYRNYLGILWKTKDKHSCKISIYNEFEKKNLDPMIEVYSSNDSLLLEYGILETLDLKRGERIKSSRADSLKRIYDYKYIDLNRLFGIKIYD